MLHMLTHQRGLSPHIRMKMDPMPGEHNSASVENIGDEFGCSTRTVWRYHSFFLGAMAAWWVRFVAGTKNFTNVSSRLKSVCQATPVYKSSPTQTHSPLFSLNTGCASVAQPRKGRWSTDPNGTPLPKHIAQPSDEARTSQPRTRLAPAACQPHRKTIICSPIVKSTSNLQSSTIFRFRITFVRS